MPLRSAPPLFSTDRQRQLGARGTQGPLARPAAPSRPRPEAAVPRTPRPLAFPRNTFIIRGKGDTYVGFAFGDERRTHQLNLADYLPADRVPRLGNYVLDLTGIVPDALGIDLGVSAGLGVFSGLTGVNVLWHTRGEHTYWPELHVYYGYSGSFTWGSAFQSLFTPPNGSAAVQLILAWAREYNLRGQSRPASNQWVANGFNWTGTFWSVGFSLPVPPGINIVGSYFQSVPLGQRVLYGIRNTRLWFGFSVGVGKSARFSVKSPFIKLDTTKLFSMQSFSPNMSKTEYGLEYGNGDDFIPQLGNKSIKGWHGTSPINQNDYPADTSDVKF